ncbi:hypothetical protein [Penaeicola halotolerans]|uniref:hypothetical protein n=1 Tax=Penaeicola halotolerans TaxID=2793196 RepID=UPI001CF908E2|nr:hypothetical protein [Penaeicola halotolerans]
MSLKNNAILLKSTLLTLLVLLITTSRLLACEVCESKQPEVLKGITHGTGPQGDIDYIIIWSAVIIVTFTLIMSVKYLIKPKEHQQDHIKHIVLEK